MKQICFHSGGAAAPVFSEADYVRSGMHDALQRALQRVAERRENPAPVGQRDIPHDLMRHFPDGRAYPERFVQGSMQSLQDMQQA